MSDFQQTEPISTLHLLGERDLWGIEKEIEEASKSRPIALVLPCLISEMDGPALKVILAALESVNYLREVLVTLGPANYEEFQRACEFFSSLQRDGRRVRIIWNDGEKVQSLYQEILDAGLSPGPHGKGRSGVDRVRLRSSSWRVIRYRVARLRHCFIY